MHAAIDTSLTSTANGIAHPSIITDAIDVLTEHATIQTATIAQLVRSRYNVRTRQTEVTELAALIRSHGLLQNLVGYRQLVDDVATGLIEIVAGGRRLRALGMLIEAGDLPQDYGISVMLVTEDEAIEISLTENLGREDMHPADVYLAMQALIDHGRAIEDLALRFELEVQTVKRYLKLARVAPRLIDLFRDGELSFEHMMAFALVDDHAAQQHAWDSLPKYSRAPHDLRRVLTAQKINTESDRVARFVGVACFEKAGGVVERDLFSATGTGYISDAVLLEKLAMEQMQRHARQLQQDGAAWVEILPRADQSILCAFGKVRTAYAALGAEDQQQAGQLEQQMQALGERIEAAYDAEDDQQELLLRDEQRALAQRHAALLATRTMLPDPGDQAMAGAVLYLDHNGKLEVLRDAIHPDDMAKRATEAGVPASGKRVRLEHSDRLTAELTSQRTVALQAEMMAQSGLALVYLTFTLMKSVLLAPAGHPRATLAKISLSRPALAPVARHSAAAAALEAQRQHLLGRLPAGRTGEGWLDWLMAQPQPVVLELLAFCTACSLDATQSREEASPDFVTLGKVLKLDMNTWWCATADSYFNHVSLARMVTVVTEAVSAEAAVPLENMKKQQAADSAQRALAEARWLPQLLRTV